MAEIMSLSFLRAKDRIANVASPERQAELKYSRFFLTEELDDDEVVSCLWEILKEEKDLDDVSTKDIREKLEKQLNLELKERKEFVNYQIMKIVGQMDPPTKILEFPFNNLSSTTVSVNNNINGVRMTNAIFLGSEWNSSNLKELKQLGITSILNITLESPNYFPKEFDYYNIRIKDADDVPIHKYFYQCFQFIDSAMEKPGKCILLHCQMGISRSASLVIAYLMKARSWSLQKAFKFVKDLRPVVKPNRGFMKQLMDFDVKLFGVNSLGIQQQ